MVTKRTFALYNRGTVDSFNPDKKVPDPFNASNKITQLEANKMYVKVMNCKNIFILDDNGKEVE